MAHFQRIIGILVTFLGRNKESEPEGCVTATSSLMMNILKNRYKLILINLLSFCFYQESNKTSLLVF